MGDRAHHGAPLPGSWGYGVSRCPSPGAPRAHAAHAPPRHPSWGHGDRGRRGFPAGAHHGAPSPPTRPTPPTPTPIGWPTFSDTRGPTISEMARPLLGGRPWSRALTLPQSLAHRWRVAREIAEVLDEGEWWGEPAIVSPAEARCPVCCPSSRASRLCLISAGGSGCCFSSRRRGGSIGCIRPRRPRRGSVSSRSGPRFMRALGELDRELFYWTGAFPMPLGLVLAAREALDAFGVPPPPPGWDAWNGTPRSW